MKAHARTTAREILMAFEGERLDYGMTGFGTGGTLSSVFRVPRRDSVDSDEAGQCIPN